jgi:aminopeptidase N
MAPRDIYNHKHNDQVRSDYRPSPYKIPEADLYIKLDATNTQVRHRVVVEGNPAAQIQGGPLILNGEDIDLSSVKIKENGQWRDLDRAEFVVDDKQLILLRPPSGRFELEIQNECNPEENTKLQGIYLDDDGIIGSQNESQGFRRITYSLDRPDNLTKYTTTLEAVKEKYPVLISNGNGDPSKTEDLGNGRHRITWVDPFPKPSYLFAAIAGDLKIVHDTFTTMSGKEVDLRIVVPKGYEDKVAFAMESIKKAMKWDEEKYGREYDLDCLHLIGLKKFNMGAMENKGAIVFNINSLCGSPETSTDTQLLRIETVVGHEYFHNWTGDRVTVRDWFEISLKESLTELRNEQFAADMNSKAIQTIDDAIYLRSVQFREDAGPTAHNVRPERAESFENIYSPTVYNKGAQVLRMMNTILGDQMWRTAMDSYFDKFDGQAVTVDDFIDNMQEVSGWDMTQFRRWYTQSGTPEISYEGKYDAAAKTYSLTLKQHTPSTPDQPAETKKPFHIPVAVGLIGESGKDVATQLLNFTEAEQTFVFKNVNGPVVPSILRDFSAPVKIMTQPSDPELIFRMAHDSDPFNRFEASERLMSKTMQNLLKDHEAGKPLAMPREVMDAYAANLAGALDDDQAFAARMLTLPAFTQSLKKYDPLAAQVVSDFVAKTLAETFKSDFRRIYAATAAPAGEKYAVTPEQTGHRELHNTALDFLAKLETPQFAADAEQQYRQSKNMTEKLGGLRVLSRLPGDAGATALADFYATYRNDTNVMDTWLSVSAQTATGDVVGRVRELMKDKVFDLTNPNKVRALMGGFTGNTEAFHNKDGSGYKLLADVIISLNEVNPHTATGIIRSLVQFDRFDDQRQKLMVAELARIMATPQLDTQIKDIVGKALESAAPELKKKAPGPNPN